MRRINSEFQTKYISEEGQQLSNRDYFGYVELDDFSCYVMADSLDDDPEANSAQIAVESLIRSFVEHPSMKKRNLRSYMRNAHQALAKELKGMRLKASVVMVVTDYKKVRYCYTGNSRFYLIRNGRYLVQSKDQSLTQNLIETEKISMDQAAIHEDRNNLYSYLGERGNPEVIVSPKIKLENGDILTKLTRGTWEKCSDSELLKIIDDAKEPQDILDQVEDLILGKQEENGEIDNYSLAVTLVGKVYESPKKKITLKQILMIVIPLTILVGGISFGFYLRHKNIKNKEYRLEQYLISGEEYLRHDNYRKASEEYTEAKKAAGDLKRSKEQAEADQYLKLADQIILADEAMIAGEYVKAQDLYLSARDLSVKAGNVGKKYIELQLEQTKEYIEVYDWISVGEIKEEYDDLEGAIEAYRKAREKASALYDTDGKEEALKKQTAVEEKLTSREKEAAAQAAAVQQEAKAEQEKQEAQQKEAEDKEKESLAAEQELENQKKANDQKNAIDLENTGNTLMSEEKYDQAITFYRSAQSIYYRLELYDLGDAMDDKIEAAQAGSAAVKEAQAAAEAALEETKNPKLTGPGEYEETKE